MNTFKLLDLVAKKNPEIILPTHKDELRALSKTYSLYLKPINVILITVKFPAFEQVSNKLDCLSISNWEIMESLKKMTGEHLKNLKVVESHREYIIIESEFENESSLQSIHKYLNNRKIKLKGLSKKSIITVAKKTENAKFDNSWIKVFGDPEKFDTLDFGKRADTVLIENLPIKWFTKHDFHATDRKLDVLPSMHITRKVFSKFGQIRNIEIPIINQNMLDIIVNRTKNVSDQLDTLNRVRVNFRPLSEIIPTNHLLLTFDVYIQYKKYNDFVNAIQSLSNCKVVYKSIREYTAPIHISFDKTHYLTDANIIKRKRELQKMIEFETDRYNTLCEQLNNKLLDHEQKNDSTEKSSSSDCDSDSSLIKPKKVKLSKEEKAAIKEESEKMLKIINTNEFQSETGQNSSLIDMEKYLRIKLLTKHKLNEKKKLQDDDFEQNRHKTLRKIKNKKVRISSHVSKK